MKCKCGKHEMENDNRLLAVGGEAHTHEWCEVPTFDYLVSEAWGGGEGKEFTSLSGGTFKVYSHPENVPNDGGVTRVMHGTYGELPTQSAQDEAG